ncbi:hypothetical protein CLCR_10850 [Cladophialophora carrionii]|uniref:Uncharacterized protein n=1 Tax=Cladophialophora carrionii TaxID=86049 RepID=A0A1C1CW74_9EURO|nr:hypothetical protein CLCR_10850 [Cladophialophora carrionii]
MQRFVGDLRSTPQLEQQSTIPTPQKEEDQHASNHCRQHTDKQTLAMALPLAINQQTTVFNVPNQVVVEEAEDEDADSPNRVQMK